MLLVFFQIALSRLNRNHEILFSSMNFADREFETLNTLFPTSESRKIGIEIGSSLMPLELHQRNC